MLSAALLSHLEFVKCCCCFTTTTRLRREVRVSVSSDPQNSLLTQPSLSFGATPALNTLRSSQERRRLRSRVVDLRRSGERGSSSNRRFPRFHRIPSSLVARLPECQHRDFQDDDFNGRQWFRFGILPGVAYVIARGSAYVKNTSIPKGKY